MRYQSHPGHASVEQLAYRLWIDNDSSNLAAIHITVSNVSTWTGLGDGITWSDAENWSDNATPGPHDNIVIGPEVVVNADTITLGPGRTLTVDGYLEVRHLQLDGGTLNGAGTVGVYETLAFNAGVMAGSGTTTLTAGATGTVTQIAGTSTAPALAGTRQLVIAGDLLWRDAFVIAPTSRVVNNHVLTFTGVTLDYDAATPITNTGTLTFDTSVINFTGPLAITGTTRLAGTGLGNGVVAIINEGAAVEFANLIVDGATLTGEGTVSITNHFTWTNSAVLSGPGQTIVAATGTLVAPSTGVILYGRTLTVLNAAPTARAWNATGPHGSRIVVMAGANWQHWLGDYDNDGVRPRAVIASGDPLGVEQADALAHQIYEAMYGGLRGVGVDDESIYAALQDRSNADVMLIKDAYSLRYRNPDGSSRIMQQDIEGQWWFAFHQHRLTRTRELLLGNQAGADAARIHHHLFSLSGPPAPIPVRDLLARGNLAAIRQEYARLYPNARLAYGTAPAPTADPNAEPLRYDLQYAFNYVEAERAANNASSSPTYTSAAAKALYLEEITDFRLSVELLFQGNPTASDAVALHALRVGAELLSSASHSERLLTFLQSKTPAQRSSINVEYTARYGVSITDSLNPRLNAVQQDILDALLNGTRFDAIASRLNRAMAGAGTDEEAVWKELDGLYADERAMVAQTYFQRYQRSLVQDIHAEFTNNPFDGPELDKTLDLLKHGGLSVARRIYYATEGIGTDENEIRRAMSELRTMTPTQIAAANAEYAALVPPIDIMDGANWIVVGQRPATLEDAFRGDLSVDFRNDAVLSLEGHITTVEQYYQLARRRWEYDRGDTASNWLGNFISGINDQGKNLDATWERIQTAYNAIPAGNRNDPIENHRDFRRVVRQIDHDVESYRGFRSAAAEVGANALATVAGMAAFAATGGTITPIIVAIAAGSTSQVLARSGINGYFDWEQLPADVVIGGANGLLGAMTLPSAARIAGTQYGILRVIGNSPFASGAAISALSTALNENTWESGNFAIGMVHIAQAAGVGGFGASALARVPGAAVNFARTTTGLTRTIATTTGRSVVNIFDASFVGAVRLAAGVREGIESVLTPQRISDIAAFLHHGFALDDLIAFRNALRNQFSDLPPLRLNFVEAGVMDVLEASRSEFATLGEPGIRTRLLDRMQAMYNSMADTVDSIAGRLVAGSVNAVDEDLPRQIAQRLGDLQNVDNAAIRQVLEELLPGQTVQDDLVLSMRRTLLGSAQPFPWRAVDIGALPDQRLVERAISLRLREGLLNQVAMGRNVAIAKVRIDGVESFIEFPNIPGGLHSEERIAAEIVTLRAQGKTVEVLELFSDRIPCVDSGTCRTAIAEQMTGVRVFSYTRLTGDAAERELWSIYSR